MLLLFLAANVSAQLVPVLGGQRVGTASAQFLKIGVGSRAAAMGDAFVAVANDASALYWNPAGISQFARNELVLSHIDWLVDIKHEFIGYVHHLNDKTTLGVQAVSLYMEDMAVTTEFQPYGTGEYFTFGDIMFGLSFSSKLTDRFSFGATVKYMEETLDDVSMNSVMIDLGTYYWTGAGTSRFAVAVTNFGPQLTPEGEIELTDGRNVTGFQSFNPPTLFRVAYAQEVYRSDSHELTTAVQLNHPNDNSENVGIGFEYRWNGNVALRGGYKLNVDEENLSLGAGVKIPLSYADFGFDYSFGKFGLLGNVNRFSVSLGF